MEILRSEEHHQPKAQERSSRTLLQALLLSTATLVGCVSSGKTEPEKALTRSTPQPSRFAKAFWDVSAETSQASEPTSPPQESTERSVRAGHDVSPVLTVLPVARVVPIISSQAEPLQIHVPHEVEDKTEVAIEPQREQLPEHSIIAPESTPAVEMQEAKQEPLKMLDPKKSVLSPAQIGEVHVKTDEALYLWGGMMIVLSAAAIACIAADLKRSRRVNRILQSRKESPLMFEVMKEIEDEEDDLY